MHVECSIISMDRYLHNHENYYSSKIIYVCNFTTFMHTMSSQAPTALIKN